MSLIHAVTGKPIQATNITCGDGKYTMYPDNTELWFQRISFNGENLLSNGEIGSGTTGPGRVMDQRCFRSDILYCVEYPIGTGKMVYCRHSKSWHTNPESEVPN